MDESTLGDRSLQPELERLDPELGWQVGETYRSLSAIVFELEAGTDEQRALARRLDLVLEKNDRLEKFLSHRARKSSSSANA